MADLIARWVEPSSACNAIAMAARQSSGLSSRCTTVPFFGTTVPIFTRIFSFLSVNRVLKKSGLDPVCGTCFTVRRTAAGAEAMRGTDEETASLFSYVDLEERIPARHPLRKIRQVANDALAGLDTEFDRLYATDGRPPDRALRARMRSAVRRPSIWVIGKRDDGEKRLGLSQSQGAGPDRAAASLTALPPEPRPPRRGGRRGGAQVPPGHRPAAPRAPPGGPRRSRLASRQVRRSRRPEEPCRPA